MNKEEFIEAFHNQYGGWLCVDSEEVGGFYVNEYDDMKERGYTDECILDLCSDYILSQGLEEEIIL